MLHRLLQDPGLPASNPTTSYWQTPLNKDVANIQSPKLPETRDIVILGSGITGLSVSWWLLKDSQSATISVLDAREICSGATGRNGGRINCTAIQDYDKYRKRYGHDDAVQIVRFELAHLDAIHDFVREAGLEIAEKSEVRHVDAIAAIFDEKKLSEMEAMLENFESAFPDLRGRWRIAGREEVVQTYNIKNAKGALIGRAGAAWPYRMVTGVFAQLLAENANRFSVEANTPALSVTKTEDGTYPYIVATPRGIIKAKHVVHCTEGHAAHLLPRLRGILVPRRGQMTVQNPASGFPQASDRSWSFLTGDLLDYATQNPRTGHIFIGGGETAGKGPVLGIPSDAEHDFLALSHLGGILPAAFGDEHWGSEVANKPRVVASWTGILCNSLDQTPLVGMLPQDLLDRPAGQQTSAEWISAGYGGYGMVNAFLSGKALAKMIGGDDVSSWLPRTFFLTPQRVEKLQRCLKRATNSEREHLKSLL
ncbi:FAD dependent oxidoreductase [Thelonectria olida]|uniref:FAD dependent oxidoreductase n=1 Tax=Thelonectria olida TaxID=1576542 RepID=A0A9P8VTI3_9HYPO|nr:FAD dependent oxidoreductase [Thelonectria olida]